MSEDNKRIEFSSPPGEEVMGRLPDVQYRGTGRRAAERGRGGSIQSASIEKRHDHRWHGRSSSGPLPHSCGPRPDRNDPACHVCGGAGRVRFRDRLFREIRDARNRGLSRSHQQPDPGTDGQDHPGHVCVQTMDGPWGDNGPGMRRAQRPGLDPGPGTEKRGKQDHGPAHPHLPHPLLSLDDHGGDHRG